MQDLFWRKFKIVIEIHFKRPKIKRELQNVNGWKTKYHKDVSSPQINFKI
jgi:hypothetical protein